MTSWSYILNQWQAGHIFWTNDKLVIHSEPMTSWSYILNQWQAGHTFWTNDKLVIHSEPMTSWSYILNQWQAGHIFWTNDKLVIYSEPMTSYSYILNYFLFVTHDSIYGIDNNIASPHAMFILVSFTTQKSGRKTFNKIKNVSFTMLLMCCGWLPDYCPAARSCLSPDLLPSLSTVW